MKQEEFFKKLNNNEYKGEEFPYGNDGKLKKILNSQEIVKKGVIYNLPSIEHAQGLEGTITKMNTSLEVKIHYNPKIEEYQMGIIGR